MLFRSARVTLSYSFNPVSPIPLAGPIVISASAAAPTGGAGGVATAVPVSTPTTAPSPTPTLPPTPVAMCSVPNFAGASLNGNTARNTWTAAGFSAANFNKDENNGTVLWQTVPPSTSTATQRPCATTSITLHNHAS